MFAQNRVVNKDKTNSNKRPAAEYYYKGIHSLHWHLYLHYGPWSILKLLIHSVQPAHWCKTGCLVPVHMSVHLILYKMITKKKTINIFFKIKLIVTNCFVLLLGISWTIDMFIVIMPLSKFCLKLNLFLQFVDYSVDLDEVRTTVKVACS